MGELTAYLESLPSPQREVLQQVVDVARRVAPEAQEGRSYGMAALRLADKPLVAVTSSARHLSLFPFSPAVVEAVAPDLEGYSLSKGTIRFTADQPLPDAVVEQVVALRRAEIEA
jgi:uncharacterized protein YdhG (YjbR/CyaY superfamily)